MTDLFLQLTQNIIIWSCKKIALRFFIKVVSGCYPSYISLICVSVQVCGTLFLYVSPKVLLSYFS